MAIGLGLVWYFYQKFTPEQLNQMKTYVLQAKYWWLGLSVFLTIISHVLRTHRWHLLLAPLDHFPKWYNSFFSVCVAYFMNLFIPKSGELSRAITLNRYEKVPMQHGLGTIISERIIDLIFLMAFFILAIGLNYAILVDYLIAAIPIKQLGWIAAGMTLLLGLFLVLLKQSKGSVAKRIQHFLKGLWDGIISVRKVKWPLIFILESLLIWALYVASFYAATFALAETTNIGWEAIIITFVVGSFTFAFTNSGIGYYPLAVAGILGLFDIAPPLGNAFGWLIWTANISAIIFFGLLALLSLPLVNKK